MNRHKAEYLPERGLRSFFVVRKLSGLHPFGKGQHGVKDLVQQHIHIGFRPKRRPYCIDQGPVSL